MAIINYTDQIKYTGKGYLDAKMMPVKTVDDLKKIPSTQRFEGLTVVVLNDGAPQDYWLIGGVSNSCWKPKTANNFNDLKLTLEDGFLKLMNKDIQLGEAVNLNEFFPEPTDKLYITTVDYTTENNNGETGIFMCFTYSDGTKKYLDMAQFLANTYEPGSGIVIEGNVISIDSAINNRFDSIENEISVLKNDVTNLSSELNDKVSQDEFNQNITEVNDKINSVNEKVAEKADVKDLELLEGVVTELSDNINAEKEERKSADLEHTNQIESLRDRLNTLTTSIETNKTNIDNNTASIAALKARVDALSSASEGSTPDGETIGITDDERKALYVKILEKEGNMLSVDSENGMTGLYASVPLFCEDEELNE